MTCRSDLGEQLAREVVASLHANPRLAEQFAQAIADHVTNGAGGWLTAPAAADYAGVSVDTLERAVRTGALYFHQPGGPRGHRLVERAELDRWIRGG